MCARGVTTVVEPELEGGQGGEGGQRRNESETRRQAGVLVGSKVDQRWCTRKSGVLESKMLWKCCQVARRHSL